MSERITTAWELQITSSGRLAGRHWWIDGRHPADPPANFDGYTTATFRTREAARVAAAASGGVHPVRVKITVELLSDGALGRQDGSRPRNGMNQKDGAP